MAGRATYTDADKAQVFVVLTTNEGNIKRTARDTNIPENTVRRWKRDWEENGAPDLDDEVVKAAVTGFLDEAKEVRDITLQKIKERVEKGDGTLAQLATILGILTDKIDRAQGLGSKVQHEHTLTLPSPDDIRATLGALVQGAVEGHRARDEEIVDAEIVEQAALPPAR